MTWNLSEELPQLITRIFTFLSFRLIEKKHTPQHPPAFKAQQND
jgi:hypothetical protein